MLKAGMKTLKSYIDGATERFEAAQLSYGHGTGDAHSDALFLIMEVLGLTFEDLDANFDQPLNDQQHQLIEKIISLRIETRKPSPYLVNRAYIQGVPFYV